MSTTLQTLSDSQVSKEVPVNENFDTLSAAGIFGKRHPATSGLTWGYYGGRYNGNTVANGTVTLTGSATNYIVVNLSTGAVSVSTSTTNWSDTSNYARLYALTTSSSAVTGLVDHRMDTGGLLNRSGEAFGTALEDLGDVDVTTPSVGDVLQYVGSDGWTNRPAPNQTIQIACSDEISPLTVGTKVTFRMPFAYVLDEVRASLTTAQASGSIFTVDINESGTSILSTKITIDNTETTSTTASTPPVISDANLADDAVITIDIDQIGNGSATGLKIALIGKPA